MTDHQENTQPEYCRETQNQIGNNQRPLNGLQVPTRTTIHKAGANQRLNREMSQDTLTALTSQKNIRNCITETVNATRKEEEKKTPHDTEEKEEEEPLRRMPNHRGDCGGSKNESLGKGLLVLFITCLCIQHT